MYRVELTHTNDLSFKVKSASYEFLIDAKGSAITPPDTLLASLASCVGVYIRKYAQGANLNLSNFTVTAEGELSKEPPVRFTNINVSVDFKGIDALDKRRKEALLNFINNCPIHNTLRGNPQIEVRLNGN